MKKSKWITLTAACAGFLIISGSVFASSSGARIFINHTEFSASQFNLHMDKGTAMVSLKSIVEQFHGKLAYKNNSIYVTMPESSDLSMQTSSLENALIAESPEEAVQTWIHGVQKRSGAMQYAVLSPLLRQKTKQEFSDHFWVTGGSSPHMGKVEKLNSKEVTTNKVQITFQYPLVVMEETIGTGSAALMVEKIERESSDYWAISSIVLGDPGDTGTMIGATASSTSK
ncbi:hypothetical protein ABEW34_20255 [Paenibacillus algorifonticola]|uniref:hypothetical protein n=1 Tax=Paenibacillus algorifonticola TaxID=684063 RepID=UPI003D2AD3C0